MELVGGAHIGGEQASGQAKAPVLHKADLKIELQAHIRKLKGKYEHQPKAAPEKDAPAVGNAQKPQDCFCRCVLQDLVRVHGRADKGRDDADAEGLQAGAQEHTTQQDHEHDLVPAGKEKPQAVQGGEQRLSMG